MSKKLKWLTFAAWIGTSLYLLFNEFQLASPYYAFFALFRAGVAFWLFVNVSLMILFAIMLLKKRFTTKTLLSLTLMVSITLGLGVAFYRNSPIKTGFAYSKDQLAECVLTGEIGDRCGVYRINDIIRTPEYTIICTAGNRDSYSPCGFIKFSDPTLTPNHDSTDLNDAGFYSLGNGWHVLYSYYNSIKMGWS